MENELILPPTKLTLLSSGAEQERADFERQAALEAIEAEELEAERRFEAAPGPKQGEARTDVKHGVCKGPRCSKRTLLWLPLQLCTKCLRKAAASAGIDIDNIPTPKGDA